MNMTFRDVLFLFVILKMVCNVMPFNGQICFFISIDKDAPTSAFKEGIIVGID